MAGWSRFVAYIGGRSTVFGITCKCPFLAIVAGNHLPWFQLLWWMLGAAVMAEHKLIADAAIAVFGPAANRARRSATGGIEFFHHRATLLNAWWHWIWPADLAKVVASELPWLSSQRRPFFLVIDQSCS